LNCNEKRGGYPLGGGGGGYQKVKQIITDTTKYHVGTGKKFEEKASTPGGGRHAPKGSSKLLNDVSLGGRGNYEGGTVGDGGGL